MERLLDFKLIHFPSLCANRVRELYVGFNVLQSVYRFYVFDGDIFTHW
jgi:hypothetical protein